MRSQTAGALSRWELHPPGMSFIDSESQYALLVTPSTASPPRLGTKLPHYEGFFVSFADAAAKHPALTGSPRFHCAVSDAGDNILSAPFNAMHIVSNALKIVTVGIC